MNEAPATLRIDKWLWAARFFKTRSLAAQALHAGRVKVNGQAVKASRELKRGECIEIAFTEAAWTIEVLDLRADRRPAEEARRLYQETEESALRRAQDREMRRLAPTPGSDLRGRPTKKARRQIHGFNENR